MYLTCITITQSTIITSLIGFNVGLTNVDARLKQCCINIVPTLCNIVSTLWNVVSTLFQCRALTLYQRCATLKIQRRILFRFQRRINVISMLIHNVQNNVDPTMKCWLGWVNVLQKIFYDNHEQRQNICRVNHLRLIRRRKGGPTEKTSKTHATTFFLEEVSQYVMNGFFLN